MVRSPASRRRFELMAAAYLERMGERIRARREELGLSRADVARLMPGKTNENAVYRWEKGLHRPNDDTLEALAEVLKTTVGQLLADEPDKSLTPDLFRDPNGTNSVETAVRKLSDELAQARKDVQGLADKMDARSTDLRGVTRRLAIVERNQDEMIAMGETVIGLLQLLVPDEQALAAESLLDQLNVARELARGSGGAGEGPATKEMSG